MRTHALQPLVGQVVAANVTSHCDGHGVIVDVDGVEAVVPYSMLAAPWERQPADGELVGQTVRCRVLERCAHDGRPLLSRRAVVEEQRHREIVDRLQNVEVGEIVAAQVVNVWDLGVFVEFDGIPGLVHNSELVWQGRPVPAALFATGDTVTAKVLDVDMDRARVSLSVKHASPDPFRSLLRRRRVGDVVDATVSAVVTFGAFVDVDGVDALVHLSEMSDEPVDDPRRLVRNGQHVRVRILEIDEASRRVHASLRGISQQPSLDVAG